MMSRGKVCIIVLAAGRSERFGAAKLLADFRGKPLLHHALSAAQGACPGNVCMVVGHNADEIGNAAAGLADQPLISSGHLLELVEMWTGGPNEIIASKFSDISGPPTLFTSGLFDQLEQLSGDVGARQVLRANPDALRKVACEAAAVDIDTRADLEALTHRH